MGELFDRLSSSERLSAQYGRAARAASSVGRASMAGNDEWDGVIDQLNIPEDLSDLGRYLRIGKLVTRTKTTIRTRRINDPTDPQLTTTFDFVDRRLNGYRLTPRWRGRGMNPIFVGIADVSVSPGTVGRPLPPYPGEQSMLAVGHLTMDKHASRDLPFVVGDLTNEGPSYSPIAVPNINDVNATESARRFIQDNLFQIGQQMQARLG